VISSLYLSLRVNKRMRRRPEKPGIPQIFPPPREKGAINASGRPAAGRKLWPRQQARQQATRPGAHSQRECGNITTNILNQTLTACAGWRWILASSRRCRNKIGGDRQTRWLGLKRHCSVPHIGRKDRHHAGFGFDEMLDLKLRRGRNARLAEF